MGKGCVANLVVGVISPALNGAGGIDSTAVVIADGYVGKGSDRRVDDLIVVVSPPALDISSRIQGTCMLPANFNFAKFSLRCAGLSVGAIPPAVDVARIG